MNMRKVLRILSLSLLLVLPAAGLSAQVRDSVLVRQQDGTVLPDPDGTVRLNPDEVFRPHKLVVPGLLFAGGAVGVQNEWFRTKVNEPLRDGAARLRGDCYLHFDNYIQYIPSAAYLGLGFAVEPEHGFQERFLTAATAWATTAVVVLSLKKAVGELRPDGSARNSFPSGHTATAFVSAELVRLEYGPWWGAGAYAIAATTAYMRIYNNRHWFNDLLGGAAIGNISANVGYWLHPWERRLFHLEDSRTSLVAVPCLTGSAAGFSLAMSF